MPNVTTNHAITYTNTVTEKIQAWKAECDVIGVAGWPVKSLQDNTMTQVFLTHLVGVF